MNSAKKVMNKQNEGKKKSSVSSGAKGDRRLDDGGIGDTKRIVIGAICVVLVLVLCIGVGIQQLSPKVVLTVDGTKYTLDDMMYPIYERESKYLPYDEMYQMYTGSSVWDNSYMGDDSSVDSSLTLAAGLKEEIINAETAYHVLYQEATNAGVELTDDEKAEVTEEVSSALKGLSFLQKLQLNISKSNLTKRFTKRKIADKYKESQQETLNESVDEDAAIKDISKKDYREYKLQYYAFSNTTTDDDGNTKKRSSKEKAKLLKELTKLQAKSQTAKDFSDLLGDDESDITYSETSFTEQDGWSMVTTKKLLKQIKALKKKQISGIIEDKKTGYTLFVKMTDNNSMDSYDEACESAIEDAQEEAYNTWYEGILENYTTSTNEDVWDDIDIGTVTTSIVTADDLEKMSEADSSDATSE
jgi:hypothetical protein